MVARCRYDLKHLQQQGWELGMPILLNEITVDDREDASDDVKTASIEIGANGGSISSTASASPPPSPLHRLIDETFVPYQVRCMRQTVAVCIKRTIKQMAQVSRHKYTNMQRHVNFTRLCSVYTMYESVVLVMSCKPAYFAAVSVSVCICVSVDCFASLFALCVEAVFLSFSRWV